MTFKTTYGSDNEGGYFLERVEIRLTRKERATLLKDGKIVRERDFFANDSKETRIVISARR